jgi:uncharacterized membrane protein
MSAEPPDRPEPPQRQTIQRDPTRSRALRPVRELADDTPLGNAYLGSLLRVQFVLAVRMTLALVAFLVLLVASLVFTGPLRSVSLFGIPAGWLLLGVVPYPIFVLFAYVFRRRSERNEQDFVTFVAESKSQP